MSAKEKEMLIITEACDGCGRCLDICPVEEAIVVGQPYAIDPGKCAECGACVNECPAQAILNG